MEKGFTLERVEREFIYYFENIDIYKEYHIHITGLRINKQKKTITIKSNRPGYFIGRAGIRINNLKEYLKKELSLKKLSFNIIEDQLWSFAYYKPHDY